MHWKGYASISLETFKSGCGCFCGLSAITIASSYFCFTGNWLGVGYGHMMLSVTERNMQQVSANMFLVKDFDTIVEQLVNEGWDILERRSGGYRLQKGDERKNIVILGKLFSGFYMIMMGEIETIMNEGKIRFQWSDIT